jgi:hypothetical protein
MKKMIFMNFWVCNINKSLYNRCKENFVSTNLIYLVGIVNVNGVHLLYRSSFHV